MGPEGGDQEDMQDPHKGKEDHHYKMQLCAIHSELQFAAALCCHVASPQRGHADWRSNHLD